MKRSTSLALIVLVQALLLSVGAFAAITVSPPHYDEASGLVCTTCHTTHLDLGSTGYNNVCQSCHRPGDAAAGAKPITPADAANPFGLHSTTGISKMYQTSHRWDGSNKNDAAGAKPPVQAQMTTSGLLTRTAGQLACVSCHNQHSNVNGSFLRMANNQDQMCLDCHRSRNTADHTRGTHPVGVDYQQKAAANPAGFNTPPVNSNPSNPSSAMKLLNGKVSCSTCHGVHMTDSHSGTVDGSANFANLSSGDGNLLRTDLRGTSVGAGFDSSTNICTNCHAGKKSHNLKGQDIQCVDCHGAHVEYDRNDPTGSKGINIHLVRRAVTPGANGSGQIFYRYTASQREYKNSANTGVCQGCHAVPPSGGIYPSEHDSNDAATCNTCHFHSSANGSFSGACTACHGYPPLTATLGGPSGLANPATGATNPLSPGAHDTHAKQRFMACNTCHTGYAAKAMPSSSIDIGFAIDGSTFKGFAGSTDGGTFNGTTLNSGNTWSAGPNTTITNGNSAITCSVYCHGSSLTGGNATPPTWTKTDGSQNACGACHGVTPATAPTTGSHTRHAATIAVSCASCHGTHVNNDHVNGSVEWNVTGLGGGATYRGTASGGTGAIAPSASFGSCANISCHSSGQAADGTAAPLTYGAPVWGGALSCADCHKNMKTDATAPGSHVKHAQTASIACATCHSSYSETSVNGATHADGSVNLSFSGIAATTTYSQGVTHPLGNGYGTCSAASCHADPYSAGTLTTPPWGSAAGCAACHTAGFTATGPATGSHAKHTAACTSCHNAATSTTVAPTTGHADGNIDVVGVGYPADKVKGSAGATCSAASCHADPYSAGTVVTPVWGTSAAGCSSCHTVAIGPTGPNTGSHAKHNDPVCTDCHTAGTTATSVPDTGHANGSINVTNGYPITAKHAAGSYTGTCSTASCHASVYGTGTAVTPVWGTTAGCSSCHSVPIGATGPATGSHVVHNNPTCTACHAAGTTATTAPTLANGHTDGNIDVTNGYPANVAKHVAGSYTGSCSTAICHGQGAPVWGATSAAPVNGFPYSSATCGKCHSQSGTVTAGTPFYSTAIPKLTANTNAKVGAHTAHLASVDSLHPALACADCHGAVTLADATHMNGSTTFNWSTLATTGNLSPVYDPNTGTCSSVYCHGGGMPSGVSTGSNITPTWNNPNYLPSTLTVAGCGTCHGFPPPVSSGHPAVTLPVGFPSASAPIGTTCSCHSNIRPAGYSYATIFVDNTKHINGTLEGGACNTCHGYPPVRAGFVAAPGNWESALQEDYVGGGGTHAINGHISKNARHNDGFAYCNKCHSPADHQTGAEFKPSSTIKVNIDQRYRMETTKQARYTSNRLDGNAHIAGTCSNISCHFGASPPWN